MRRALITGIAGQDGSHLAEFLLDLGYDVFGLLRPGSSQNPPRLKAIRDRITLLPGDLLDEQSVRNLLEECQPHEIYNLASISFLPACWENPIAAIDVGGLGVLRLLEAMHQVCPTARLFQASSSEMFGQANESPQRETTPFRPTNPYGAAKLLAHQLVGSYRDKYGLFACSGILFNHEGPRRGLQFVTRKITWTAARIHLGIERELRLGNLLAQRDWSYAGDTIRAMWLMLQQDLPDDFVIGTGVAHTIEQFVAASFDRLGLDWKEHVVIDPRFHRPIETMPLRADPGKANRVLGWQAEVSFQDLVGMMVDADVELALSNLRVAEAAV